MKDRPPLSNREVYDLLHEAWLSFRGKKAATEEGQAAIKSAGRFMEGVQRGLLQVEDYRDRTGDRD